MPEEKAKAIVEDMRHCAERGRIGERIACIYSCINKVLKPESIEKHLLP